MNFSFKFTDAYPQIISKLNDAMIKKLSKQLYSSDNIKIVEKAVRLFVKSTIQSSKVWKSLSGGDPKGLDKHFGIPKGTVIERLDILLNIWADQILVKPNTIKRAKSFILSYDFYAVYADWADVLDSEAGVTYNKSKLHPEGQRLHWLSWLLIEGDQLEIDGYSIKFGPNSASRSGGAIMVPKLSWRIPTGFGPFNSNSNFVTRQLDLVAKSADFRKVLIDAMQKVGRTEPTIDDILASFRII